jgi:hypothetical protein
LYEKTTYSSIKGQRCEFYAAVILCRMIMHGSAAETRSLHKHRQHLQQAAAAAMAAVQQQHQQQQQGCLL